MRDTDIKKIYNIFLKISRTKQNKPYKFKTNFTDFENSPNYPYLIKLKNFFDRNYVVNIEDFFYAPYEVYNDNSYYGLDFYVSLNASKVYGIYCNIKNSLDPDSDIQTESILRGLKFIKEFCIQNKLTLGDYLIYKEKDDLVSSFILHLKEKNISVYNLFPFKNLDNALSKVDYETLKFILNDTIIKLSIYRTKFLSSKKAKLISTSGLKLIEKEINNKLEKK
jgi:hypothetical protein